MKLILMLFNKINCFFLFCVKIVFYNFGENLWSKERIIVLMYYFCLRKNGVLYWYNIFFLRIFFIF